MSLCLLNLTHYSILIQIHPPGECKSYIFLFKRHHGDLHCSSLGSVWTVCENALAP